MTGASFQHVDGAWMARGGVRYLSVCSGVEAASLAWEPLGWTPVAFSEIAPFPSAVLAHRFGSNMPGEALAANGVPNLGDMTKFREWPDYAIDLLVGGTPCQSFSVAGLRAGLADPRGNLALVYLGILERYRPRWFLWENVPGVLSSWTGDKPPGDLAEGERWEADETSDFGCFIAGIQQLGYGIAYRVLDAQYVRVDGFGRAVPQRRRRVFVVGHSGADWRRPAAVLFDAESLRRGSAPRREARQGASPYAGGGPDGGRVSGAVSAKWAKGTGGPAGDEAYNLVAHEVAASLTRGAESAGAGGYAGRRREDDYNLVAHALRGTGFDASEDGTGRGTPIVPVRFDARQSDVCFYGDIAGPLDTDGASQAVAFDLRGREGGAQFEGPHDTANIRAASGGSSRSYVAEPWAVRRLMPVECERLQGIPDGWTDIPFRGRAAADGPRYQAIGNSMAVNVMRWIGKRIALVDGFAA